MKRSIQLLYLYWLRFWARLQLGKNKDAVVVGITGSAGKGSTREALYAGIRDLKQVRMLDWGNSETGVALNILGFGKPVYGWKYWLRVGLLAPWQYLTFSPKYEVLIVEMGIDGPDWPKNMEYLLSVVQPDIGVFLNAGTVHGEMFDTLVALQGKINSEEEYEAAIRRLIAEEKGRLVLGAKIGVVNGDDSNVMAVVDRGQGELVRFGKEKESAVRLVGVMNDLQDGFTAEFEVNRTLLARHSDLPSRQVGEATTSGESYSDTERDASQMLRAVQDDGLMGDDVSRYLLRFTDQLMTEAYGYNFAAVLGVGLSLNLLAHHSDLPNRQAGEATTSGESYRDTERDASQMLRVDSSTLADWQDEVTPEQIIQGIEQHLELPPSRMSLLAGINGSMIVDASYNASEDSMRDAVAMMDNLKVQGKKIGVFGDMREIGDRTEVAHRELMEEINPPAGGGVFDELVLVGPYFGAVKQDEVWFERADEAAEYVRRVLSKGDVVLVKGSQNMIYLEYVVEQLLANEADKENLCRRGEFWEKVKGEWFG